MQTVVGQGEVLQRGSIEEFIRESPVETVVANVEHSEHVAITKPTGDIATELIVRKVKHRKGRQTDAERRRYPSVKSVVARIESNQIPRFLPCGGWKFFCKQVA